MVKRSIRRKGGRPGDINPAITEYLEQIGEIINELEHPLQREEDQVFLDLFDAIREYNLEMIHPNHYYSRSVIVRYLNFSREHFSRIVSILPGYDQAELLITALEEITAIVKRIQATIAPVRATRRRSRSRSQNRTRTRSTSRTPQL